MRSCRIQFRPVGRLHSAREEREAEQTEQQPCDQSLHRTDSFLGSHARLVYLTEFFGFFRGWHILFNESSSVSKS